MPMLLELLKDTSVVVRDTAAWTVGRVCEILPEAVINEHFLNPLLHAMVEGLNAEPRVAANVCWVSWKHSGHFYCASSCLLLLRSAPDTARILCWSFTLKRHRQLRVKDLPKVHVATRAAFKPTALRSKGFDSTNAPPRLVSSFHIHNHFY